MGRKSSQCGIKNDLGRKYMCSIPRDLLEAVWSAFNNIEIFQKVYEYYKGNEPSDEIFLEML